MICEFYELTNFISSVQWPKSKSLNASKNLQRVVHHYRGIYIFNEDFNTAFGSLFIPVCKSALGLAFIVSFVAVVRLWSDMNALSCTMVFAVSITTAFLLVPISSMMSSLFDTSAKLERNVMKIVNTTLDATARKYWKLVFESCPVVRCKVGGMYYMEAKAKLTLFQHLINGVVTVLVNVKR